MPKLRICLKLRISPSLDILGDFWTNWAENFCWCLEDYYQFNRSVLINPSYRDYFLILILLAFFSGKWAWLPRWRQRVWGLKLNCKVGPLGGLFGSTGKYVFNTFRVTPLSDSLAM